MNVSAKPKPNSQPVGNQAGDPVDLLVYRPREELIAKVIDIAKRNSCSINRQLSADEYQTEVWALANNAAEEIADFITEQTRLARVDLLTNIENALLDRSIGLTNEETAVKWDDIQAVLAQLAPKPEKGQL